MNNSHSRLSEHKLKKGKFITPFNDGLGNIATHSSWSTDRLPEYLWLALIIKYYGRNTGFKKCLQILHRLISENKDIAMPKWSSILNLDSYTQCLFYDFVSSTIDSEVLAPLTIIYPYSEYPEFSKYFFNPKLSVSERNAQISDVLKECFHQQSHAATDIKYLLVWYAFTGKKIEGRKQDFELLSKFPLLDHSHDEMRMIRPSIRSLEMALQILDINNTKFTDHFWEVISKMSDCELFYIKFPEVEYDSDTYMESVQKIIRYLSEFLKADDPLNNKQLVLLGILTYSYKCMLEVVNYNLYNTIVARSSIRVTIENYIMMKYLLLKEPEQTDIWTAYQYYGIGLYKLILTKSRESKRDLSKSHVEYKYLDAIVNEYILEEYIDMDTSYFDKQGIREKAIAVDERELYGLFYDYDSSYAHGLWGAIRESSLLKCQSPSHQYHCVPDYENSQNLKSIWHDCVHVMNKTIRLMHSVYPVPQELLDEVDRHAN